MNINLKNRLCIIIGPTASGKTTLSNKIKKEFGDKCVIISHDDVLATIPKNQSQDEINLQFRTTLLSNIQDALEDKTNKLVVLDTINIQKNNFIAFILGMRMILNYQDEITVIKMATKSVIREKFFKNV